MGKKKGKQRDDWEEEADAIAQEAAVELRDSQLPGARPRVASTRTAVRGLGVKSLCPRITSSASASSHPTVLLKTARLSPPPLPLLSTPLPKVSPPPLLPLPLPPGAD